MKGDHTEENAAALDREGLLRRSLKGDGQVSLEGMYRSVEVPHHSAGFWMKLRAYFGPALLVSVGYMDPGNWATDLSAGAEYKYDLLWVVVLASLMAMVLQVLSARLGIVGGKDLAQASRDWYPRWSRIPNWILCEIAIIACDLAEVLGSAVAINLLFKIPIFWAVIISACNVFLILSLQRYGVRTIEAIVLGCIATIAGCFFIELFILPKTIPDFMEMASALSNPGLRQAGMATAAVGIIGATVMPHNLYLHSALVQSRNLKEGDEAVRSAIRFNTIDSILALVIAFFINASILILAAHVFYETGAASAGSETDWIRVAYRTLEPLLGTALASTLFAVALLASGQSSTITGTLAGQVVMEGFTYLRLSAWVRRLITRALAIGPAIVVVGIQGDGSVTGLLVLSQVVLAMQLPFAILPLLHFTSSKKFMGKWANGWFLLAAGWLSAIIIIGMDIYALPEALRAAWSVIGELGRAQ